MANAIPGHTLLPAPNGIEYPLILQLALLSLEFSGIGGCSLKVSLITDFKYLSSLRHVSSTFPFAAYTFCTSVCAVPIIHGFRISSDITHSTVVDDVSLPAVNMSIISFKIFLKV